MNTEYKIETFRSKGTTAGYFIRLDAIVGKGILVSDGWQLGPNPKYLSRGDNTIYFNSIMKVWVFI